MENSGVWVQIHLNFARTVSSTHYSTAYSTFEIMNTYQCIAMWKVFYKLIEKLLIIIKHLLITLPRYRIFLSFLSVKLLLDIMSPCFSLIWDCVWGAPSLVRYQGFSIKAMGGGGILSVPHCSLSLQDRDGHSRDGESFEGFQNQFASTGHPPALQSWSEEAEYRTPEYFAALKNGATKVSWK